MRRLAGARLDPHESWVSLPGTVDSLGEEPPGSLPPAWLPTDVRGPANPPCGRAAVARPFFAQRGPGRLSAAPGAGGGDGGRGRSEGRLRRPSGRAPTPLADGPRSAGPRPMLSSAEDSWAALARDSRSPRTRTRAQSTTTARSLALPLEQEVSSGRGPLCRQCEESRLAPPPRGTDTQTGLAESFGRSSRVPGTTG